MYLWYLSLQYQRYSPSLKNEKENADQLIIFFTEDPLMADVADEYEYRRDQFSARAKEYTMKFASQAATPDEGKGN